MVLVNDREIMGDYVNGPIRNFIGWTTVIVLSLLSFVLLVLGLIR